jgi:hypothetical protein
LVLHSRIFPHVIATDKRVLAFAEREADDDYLEQLLKEEKEKFQAEVLVKTFNWDKVVSALHDWLQIIPGKKLPEPDATLQLCQDLIKKAIEQRDVAGKFQTQLRSVLQSGNKDLLQQRVNKAVLYFAKQLVDDIIVPLQNHLASLRFASKVLKYTKELRVIEGMILQHLEKLNGMAYGDLIFVQYEAPAIKPQPVVSKTKKEKPEKGASHKDTLKLFREGKTLLEIASLRNLTIGTVEGHLASFVYSGDLELDELVVPSKSKTILAVIDQAGMTATSIKHRLGEDFSFGEIRAVMNWHRLQQEQKKQLT